MGAGRIRFIPRTLVDKARLDEEAVNIDVLVLLGRIRDSRFHDFFNFTRRFRLVGEFQRHQRLVHIFPADEINHEPCFLRRHADESTGCSALHSLSLTGFRS